MKQAVERMKRMAVYSVIYETMRVRRRVILRLAQKTNVLRHGHKKIIASQRQACSEVPIKLDLHH
jgi:hypothetical protein